MTIRYPITWFYYKNLEDVIPFYQDVLDLELWRDQGWAKIFTAGSAYVGLVDESRGSVDAAEEKPVLLTLVVDDVSSWYDRVKTAGVTPLTEPTTYEEIGVQCFFLEDPAGYKIEIQRWVD